MTRKASEGACRLTKKGRELCRCGATDRAIEAAIDRAVKPLVVAATRDCGSVLYPNRGVGDLTIDGFVFHSASEPGAKLGKALERWEREA